MEDKKRTEPALANEANISGRVAEKIAVCRVDLA